MLDSVLKANKKYYPQTLLEECKYAQENIKTEYHLNDYLERSESESDSNDETESDMIIMNKFKAMKAFIFRTRSVY